MHVAFQHAVAGEQFPRLIYDLSRYDVIVIDEISMISQAIFHHILKTLNCLPLRPVLLLCGDNAQMQPFDSDCQRSDCQEYSL